MIRHIPYDQNPLLVGRQAAETARARVTDAKIAQQESLAAITDWRRRARQLLDDGHALFGNDEQSGVMLDAVKAERAVEAHSTNKRAAREHAVFYRRLSTSEIVLICVRKSVTSYLPLGLILALLLEFLGVYSGLSIAISGLFSASLAARKFFNLRASQAANYQKRPPLGGL